ncbi:unnamed protein product [Pocillopora meandrina]|uniref:Endonuclease/exonuclease/phosphatase domain-containing protein n=1 Tax=Pocillopora meandrina TaxID=46732 RepID=A0AAU9VZW8_9CNID|nr:unnamed protein product [Pocillopora meandrina]
MTLTYSRSTLLSLRFWWKNPTQLIKPLRHSEWTACKLAGILKPTRGTRGGMQRKIQVDHRVNFISRRNQFDIGCLRAKGKHDSVNHGNFLNIQNHTSSTPSRSEVNSVTTSSLGRPHFVPSIFLSNTMSLVPRIDEIAHTLINFDADIALFTESWLSGCVPDSPINIKGYQLFRRDRVGCQHEGVCMYVKDSTQCKILSDLHHEDHEALWATLRPTRLPRGFSNIIVGMVYQPPNANDSAMRDYLVSSLISLEANFSNCAIILAGDFNRSLLPMVQSAVKAFLSHFLLEVIILWIKFSPTSLNFSLLHVAFLLLVYLTTCLCLWGRESGRHPLSLNARSSSPETRDSAKEPVRTTCS